MYMYVWMNTNFKYYFHYKMLMNLILFVFSGEFGMKKKWNVIVLICDHILVKLCNPDVGIIFYVKWPQLSDFV